MVLSFPWWVWAVFCVTIALAELHAPGYYFIWIAAGAGITAILTAVAPISSLQVVTFAAACVVSCICGYFVYGKLYGSAKGDQALNQRTLEMVGRRAIICVPITNGQGKVRLGDSVWLAEGPDLPAGTPVTVKSTHGTVLVVAELRQSAAEP
jgi:inner membrane protein